jgi:type I restriction enzyme M protein
MVDILNETTPAGSDIEAQVLVDDMLEDFLTGHLVKNTPRERVRQRLVRALSIEYAISLEDIGFDFPIPIENSEGRIRRRKVEIAIFRHKATHHLEHLKRIVICRPEPVLGRKSVVKIRDHEQASKDLEELRVAMGAVASCDYGLWTNGLDFFFLHKEVTRFGLEFQPQADWPVAETLKVPPASTPEDYMRRADPEMLRTAFRRCHNFIHGNEGMPKDAAFWQFLYLIFAKMQDEREPERKRRFFAQPTEPYTPEGRKRIRERVEGLFSEVLAQYGPSSESPIFRGNEEITLSDRALAFLVAELQRYDLSRTDLDAKGIAYQELVGTNLRGDRGQYFTPRGAIQLVVQILDPKETDRVLDPACGTGGFLTGTLNYLLRQWRREEGDLPEIGARQRDHRARLRAYAETRLFGADFDPFLVRATSMNVMLVSGTVGHVFHMDSLAFPDGHLPGNELGSRKIKLGSIDLVLTNPPFGADIPITDPQVLDHFASGIAKSWRKDKKGEYQVSGRLNAVAPEVLFIQRSVEWLKEGGRLGIVLPSGILSNPGDAPIRRWILENCWVLASVDLPMETFIAEANVNIYTSLLFLKKKTRAEREADLVSGPTEYPVFMAIAEKVGVDRRGGAVYKRTPEGELVLKATETREFRVVNGELKEIVRTRREPVRDDDLPRIGELYLEFRSSHPEPGRSNRSRD